MNGVRASTKDMTGMRSIMTNVAGYVTGPVTWMKASHFIAV